jgi:GxxExxY protein
MQDAAEIKARSDQFSKQIITAAIEVHRVLGPGLLESAYESCLCHELDLQKISYEKQIPLPIEYKGLKLDCAYRIDVLVGGLVIVELKAIEALQPIHDAQLLTYLKLTNLWLGLLINFNTPLLKFGIKRIVNGLEIKPLLN